MASPLFSSVVPGSLERSWQTIVTVGGGVVGGGVVGGGVVGGGVVGGGVSSQDGSWQSEEPQPTHPFEFTASQLPSFLGLQLVRQRHRSQSGT